MQRSIYLSILFLITFQGVAQRRELTANKIYGKWRCVKFDKRGYQRFLIDKAIKIKKSTLYINKDEFSYRGKNFKEINPCFKWIIQPYNFSTPQMDMLYVKDKLKHMLICVPADKKGEDLYFDDYIFVLNKDTLINIVGGYKYYRVKVN